MRSCLTKYSARFKRKKMKPTLSISILVSRKRESLEKCLQSLQPFFDELQTELVVVDTGAPPEAIELVKKYTDQVLAFPWCDDFAAARNAGLSACHGEWFLYIDDDEWFEDAGDIIRFLKSEDVDQYGRLCYIQRNYSDFSGSAYQDVNVERMERRTEKMRFLHAIHEELVPVEGDIYYSSSYVHHYGYVYENEAAKKRHDERNLSLLIKECQAYPNDLRMHLQLIQEYLIQGKDKEALKEATGQFEMVQRDDTCRQSPFFSWLCELYVKCLFVNQEYATLFSFADELNETQNCSQLGRLAVNYHAMLACVNSSQGEKNQAYALAVDALQCELLNDSTMLARQEIQGLSGYTDGTCREVTLQLLSIFLFQAQEIPGCRAALEQMRWNADPYGLQKICIDIRREICQ